MLEHDASGSIRYGPIRMRGKLRLAHCRLSAGYGPCAPAFLTQEVIGQQRGVVQTQIPEIDVCCLFRLQHLDWNSFCRIHQIRISFDVIRFVDARRQQDEGTKRCTQLNLVASLKPEGQMVSHTSRCGTVEVRLTATLGQSQCEAVGHRQVEALTSYHDCPRQFCGRQLFLAKSALLQPLTKLTGELAAVEQIRHCELEWQPK